MVAPEGYSALGKIGISYKGEYASSTAYERLDAVAHNGSTYLAIKDAPDGAPRDDKVNWIYLAKGFSGDIGDSEIAFTEAENRENINTGESVKTVFGKIKKFFADLTAPAFAQMITSKDDLLATKATGYVPDAKAVADGFADVNGKLGDFFVPLTDQQTAHTIDFDRYDAIKIQFMDQAINSGLFCKDYLRPNGKQIHDSIALHNGTSMHILCFTLSFDQHLKYIVVSDTYSYSGGSSDDIVSRTSPKIQAVYGITRLQ